MTGRLHPEGHGVVSRVRLDIWSLCFFFLVRLVRDLLFKTFQGTIKPIDHLEVT